MSRTQYAIGNWKMNGARADLSEIDAIAAARAEVPRIQTVMCLPATLLASVTAELSLGGQDCHPAIQGAHTGDISASMLADAGASSVILGHSERRTDHGEASELVAEKVQAAWAAGLNAILCIGETEAQYRAHETMSVLQDQLTRSVPDGANAENTIIAYEPVWAIGTGLTPTPNEIETVHLAIRDALPDPAMSILYGGSVKPSNAAEIFALSNVDGALVGGASLKATDFIPIMRALEESFS